MSAIEVRKKALTIETVYHEGGPAPATPLRMAAAVAVVKNPFAGRYEADLMPFMAELRGLGKELATDLVDALGKDRVEAYGKAAIVGVDGELEHGAVWHEAGGWAMRQVLGEPKAIVPAAIGRLSINGGQGVRVDPALPGLLRSQPGVRAVHLKLAKPWAN